ncbi:MAG: RNA-guided endonuclease TnpB family protein, partial [Nanoarchaeota archaeon]
LQKSGNKYIVKKEWQDKDIPLQFHFKFPNFKKKNLSDSFYLESSKGIKVEGKNIRLPKIGWVKSHEELPELVSNNLAISKQAGKWFVAYRVERLKILYKKENDIVGVDLGIKSLAKLSCGKNFKTEKRYKHYQKKLSRFQRKSQRQSEYNEIGSKFFLASKNYQKTNLQIQKIHYKISCIRKNSLHQLTSYLSKNHRKVVIEDLNISGMMKNHNLAGAIANGSFYEFRRQLTYKCDWYGTELVVADRFFASSKTCSCCGHKQEMPLKKRIFDCEKCYNKMDRDLNASINLMNYGKNYAVSSTVEAFDDAKFQNKCSVGIREKGIKHQTL